MSKKIEEYTREEIAEAKAEFQRCLEWIAIKGTTAENADKNLAIAIAAIEALGVK